MANREALRELQARLATRLQAARSEGMSVAWLAVTAGGARYLFPLAQAGEIFPLSSLQPVPYAKDWFCGVLNIRGSLFGVVDLAAFAGAALSARSPTGEASVVTLNTALDVNCALLVDTLAGLRGSDAFRSFTPAAADAPPYFGNCFVDAQGLAWQEINLRTLSQSPQFLSISA